MALEEPLSAQPPADSGTEADYGMVVQSGQTRRQTRPQLRTAIFSALTLAVRNFLNAGSDTAARTAIGAAKSGSNSDITGLSALSVALSVGQGGTGGTTAGAARTALGVQNATAGHVDGLGLVWNSANSISVRVGSAWVESVGGLVNVPALITKSSLVLSATTWYHVYLFTNLGVADVEIVTTAPAAAYFGTARSKTGDTSRRYIGSIRTGAANTIYNFKQVGRKVHWLGNTVLAPFLVLSSGQAVVATNIDCSAVVPVTGVAGQIALLTSGTGAAVMYIANPDAGTVSSSFAQTFVPGPGSSVVELSLSSTQRISYVFDVSPGTGTAFIRVYGYTFEL